MRSLPSLWSAALDGTLAPQIRFMADLGSQCLARSLVLILLFAASASAAERPITRPFALREMLAVPAPAPEMRLRFEAPQIDYSVPARPERKKGLIAAMQVSPNAFLGIGMSDKKPRRSALGPDPAHDARRGGKKLALRYILDF